MEKLLDMVSQYGVSWVILVAIGVFLWAVWKWCTVNVFKPRLEDERERSKAEIKRKDAESEAEIKRFAAETASRIALNERLGIFMTVMAQHASTEEKRMLELSNNQTLIAETQQRLVLQKDSVELIASKVRAMESQQGGQGT